MMAITTRETFFDICKLKKHHGVNAIANSNPKATMIF